MNTLQSPEVISKIQDERVQAVLSGTAMSTLYSGMGFCRGSSVLNAHTLACDRLRRDPKAELVKEPITVNDEKSPAAGFLISLLNQSLTRDGESIHRFSSGSIRHRDHCAQAEFKFIEALGYTGKRDGYRVSQSGSNNKLYVDDNDNLVFVRKALGVRSTLSAVPVTLNGIEYPAGMLFTTMEHKDAPAKALAANVEAVNIDAISRMAPLRLSAFAFEPQYIKEVFSENDGSIVGEDYPDTDAMRLGAMLTPVSWLAKYGGSASSEERL